MVSQLQTELTEANAQVATYKITDENSGRLTQLVKSQIANGTELEQIYTSLQSLGVPTNCRLVFDEPLAVATALYGGEESKVSLFDGGVRLSIEGAINENGNKANPWFDPFPTGDCPPQLFRGQSLTEDTLPFNMVIPAQDWLLDLKFTTSDLRGYVDLKVYNCVVG